MNVKQFKIHVLRGLVRPEYFYIPLLEHIKQSFYILIDKVDASHGNVYLPGAELRLYCYEHDNLPDCPITGCVKTYEYSYRSDDGSYMYSYIQFITGDGRINISGLLPGRYEISEINPPRFYRANGTSPTSSFLMLSDGSCVIYHYQQQVITDNLFTVENQVKNEISFVAEVIGNPSSYKKDGVLYSRCRNYWEIDDEYGATRIIYGVGRVHEDGSDNSLFRCDWWNEIEDGSFDVSKITVIKIYDKGEYKGYFVPVHVQSTKVKETSARRWVAARGDPDWKNILEMADSALASDTDYARRCNDYWPRKMWRWEESPPPNYSELGETYVRFDGFSEICYSRTRTADGQNPWEKKYGSPPLIESGWQEHQTSIDGVLCSVLITEMTVNYDSQITAMAIRRSSSYAYLTCAVRATTVSVFPASGFVLRNDTLEPYGYFNGETTTSSSSFGDSIYLYQNGSPTALTVPDYSEIEFPENPDASTASVDCIYYGDGLTKDILAQYQTYAFNGRGPNNESIVCYY